MLKPIDPNAARRPQRDPMPPEVVNNVFKVLHGFYGNLFLSKFANGQTDKAGEDQGIVSARQVWAYGLRDFDGATVKAALAQCITRHPDFPPNLPQFSALCAANKVRETHSGVTALGMSPELRSRYTAEARASLARMREKTVHMATGYVALPATLDGLKQAIAHAVATAGGDEAATLRRLDVEMAPRARKEAA